MRLEAMRFYCAATIVTHCQWQEMILDIGVSEFFIGTDKAATFELVRSPKSCTIEQPFRANGWLIPPFLGRRNLDWQFAFILPRQL